MRSRYSNAADQLGFDIAKSVSLLRSVRVSMLCFFLLLLLGCADAAPRIPLSVPIKFGLDRFVEFPVTIDRYRNYRLILILLFDGDAEREFVRKIVGEAETWCQSEDKCGETASFDITIKSGKTMILHQQQKTFGSAGFGANGYMRRILMFPLRPGTYDIKVEALEFGPNMPTARTQILLTTDANASDLGD